MDRSGVAYIESFATYATFLVSDDDNDDDYKDYDNYDDDNGDDDDDDDQPHCQRLYDQLGLGSYFPPLDLSPLENVVFGSLVFFDSLDSLTSFDSLLSFFETFFLFLVLVITINYFVLVMIRRATSCLVILYRLKIT